jgi:hypothetical protein
MGAEEEHARFTLRANGRATLQCVLFRHAQAYEHLLIPGCVVDVAGEVGINEFRGSRNVQLLAKDIKRGDLV